MLPYTERGQVLTSLSVFAMLISMMKTRTTMKEIEVVRDSATAETAYKGMSRRVGFELESLRFSTSRIPPGKVSDWHYHGGRELFGYIISGKLQLEFGKDGAEAVVLGTGDFFRVPVGLVHRDVNEGADEALVVSFLMGSGSALVNVSGPD